MKRIVLSVVLFSAALVYSFSQGYKLDFRLTGLSDTTIVLGNYFAGNTYIADSAVVNGRGKFQFADEEKLDPGMYFLVLDKTKLFDFIVGEDQTFRLEADVSDLLGTLQVEGDLENQWYQEDRLYNRSMNQRARPLIATIRDSLASEADKAESRAALQELDQQVRSRAYAFMEAHPESVLASMYAARYPLPLPEFVDTENVSAEQQRRAYYKAHYWDWYDVGNPVFLRLQTSVYNDKMDEYLDRLVPQQSDSIKAAIRYLAELSSKHEETYQYLVWNLAVKYQRSNIMGHDAFFVFIVDEYFETGEMDFWANEIMKNNLMDRANELRHSLIGMQAPNLIMQNADLERRELYALSADYTVLYLYDPDCGHCRTETPILKSFQDSTEFDVEVFAVCVDTSLVKMKEYIAEMGLESWTNVNGPRSYNGPIKDKYDSYTTPMIYVMDRQKKIIAKRLSADQIEDFLTRFSRTSVD